MAYREFRQEDSYEEYQDPGFPAMMAMLQAGERNKLHQQQLDEQKKARQAQEVAQLEGPAAAPKEQGLLEQQFAQLQGDAKNYIRNGEFADRTSEVYRRKGEIKAQDAVSRQQHEQYKANDAVVNDYAAKFGNRYRKSEASKLNNTLYNTTPAFGYSADVAAQTIDPKTNPDLYDYQVAAQDFAKERAANPEKYESKVTTEKGDVTRATDVSKSGVFMMPEVDEKGLAKTDKAGNVILKPGISDKHIDNYLEMDEGLAKSALTNTAQKRYAADLDYIRRNPEMFPDFAGRSEAEQASLIEAANPLRGNKKIGAYVRDLAYQELDKHQKTASKYDTSLTRDEPREPKAEKENQLVLSPASTTYKKEYATPETFHRQPDGSLKKTGGGETYFQDHTVAGIQTNGKNNVVQFAPGKVYYLDGQNKGKVQENASQLSLSVGSVGYEIVHAKDEKRGTGQNFGGYTAPPIKSEEDMIRFINEHKSQMGKQYTLSLFAVGKTVDDQKVENDAPVEKSSGGYRGNKSPILKKANTVKIKIDDPANDPVLNTLNDRTKGQASQELFKPGGKADRVRQAYQQAIESQKGSPAAAPTIAPEKAKSLRAKYNY